MKNKKVTEQIFEKVNKLTYSDASSCELMSFSNSACSFILERDSIGTQSKFKERFVQIRDKQIRPILESELLEEEKKILFTDAKENLTLLLQELLATG
jgi:hypothetical protein